MRRRSLDEYEAGPEGADVPAPTTGGTVLGIHNLAIVMPQFIVSLNCSPPIRSVPIFFSGCFSHECNLPNC